MIRLPAEEGVTGILTGILPVVAPRIILAPLAVQVNRLLPLMEQLIYPGFVIPVMAPKVGKP